MIIFTFQYRIRSCSTMLPTAPDGSLFVESLSRQLINEKSASA